MTLWFDAHLSPRTARWVGERFDLTAKPLRELGLRAADDSVIWAAARMSQVVLVTKDADFEELLRKYGPPPQIIWLTCGNTSEARLKEVFEDRLEETLALLAGGEPLVEIQ